MNEHTWEVWKNTSERLPGTFTETQAKTCVTVSEAISSAIGSQQPSTAFAYCPATGERFPKELQTVSLPSAEPPPKVVFSLTRGQSPEEDLEVCLKDDAVRFYVYNYNEAAYDFYDFSREEALQLASALLKALK